jgi:cellulose synthase/poly-beta-1,6-N-acetylglucosamine synthase-like glycosyltransferase
LDRATRVAASPGPRAVHRAGVAFLGVCGVAVGLSTSALLDPSAMRLHTLVFWGALGVLGYLYVGYPLLVVSIRAWRLRPARKAAIEPRVCLLIPANDEATVIEAKLRNSLQLDYPASRLSIVIASDGSLDSTNDIVRSFAPLGVRLVELPRRSGKVAAIKAGMALVDSEIVVLSDANTILAPDAVRALVSNFADGTVGAVSADVVIVGERAALARPENFYYRYERWLQRAESDTGSMVGVDGGLNAIRRDLFVAPADDTILDDMAIPFAVIRQGRRVVFERDAIAYERGSDSAAQEFSRKVRIVAGGMQFLLREDSSARGRLQVMLALFSHKGLRWLSPVFALLGLGASVALARGSAAFLDVVALESAFLCLGLLGCVPLLRRWPAVGVPHYLCLVHAAALVGLIRGLAGRQAVAWRRFGRADRSKPGVQPIRAWRERVGRTAAPADLVSVTRTVR